MKKITAAFLFVILGAFSLVANTSAYTADLANEAVSYDKTYVLDVVGNNITYATAQADNTDATPALKTFTDGNSSTGSITIGTLAKLTTAYASDIITILTVTGLGGAGISIGPVSGLPGHVFIEGRDWRKGATPTAAALSLATAMTAKIPGLTFTPNAGAITITAPRFGTYYNSIPVSSNNSSMTVLTPTLTGGQDNAVVTINGVALKMNKDWYVGTTSATAATSLTAAINANSILAPLMTATANSPSAGIVALASDATGATKNFAMVSSIPTYLVLSNPTMTGGVDSAYTTGSAVITIPAHGFNTALPVLYAEGAAPLDPLVDQTTYFVNVVDANHIRLALTSTGAIAGTSIALTSTPSPVNTYTLTPTPLAGISSFKWETSNDALSWTDMSVASVTISDYGTLPLTTAWDFGNVGFHYLRLNVVAPTGGALGMKMSINGLPFSEFVRTTGDTMTGPLHISGACILGAAAALPTSGVAEGCWLYDSAAHVQYISTETVVGAQSWKALW